MWDDYIGMMMMIIMLQIIAHCLGAEQHVLVALQRRDEIALRQQIMPDETAFVIPAQFAISKESQCSAN
jgi:hypothetical protein